MSRRISTAMVLAAGLGLRMRPLTLTMPKPLVPLGGKPLLDHVLDRLASAGITRAVVNVHYMADMIEAHLRTQSRPQVVVSDERDQLLETGGGVTKAVELLGADAFLIHNSDSVWIEGQDPNIDRLIDAWDGDRMDALLLLTTAGKSLGYDGLGDFEMSAGGVISRRLQGQTAPFVFTGVSIAHPRLLEGAPQGPFSLNRPWDRAMARGRLHGMLLDGLWMHIGTPEALASAERLLNEHQTLA